MIVYYPASTDDIIRETEKAILVEVSAGDMRGTRNDVWLPKSQITLRNYTATNATVIEMPEWLAKDKHMIAGCDDEFHPDVIGWKED